MAHQNISTSVSSMFYYIPWNIPFYPIPMIVLQMALSPLIQLSFLGKSWSQIPCDHDTSMTHLNDTWLTSHDNQIISDHLIPSWQSSHLRQNLPWTNRSKVLCWRTPLICWVCVAWMLKLWPRPDWGRVSRALERSIFWEMIKLWCQDFGRIS